MSQADRPNTDQPTVDRAGQVEIGITCCKCSYDLRGLAVLGMCPECGVKIAISIERAGYDIEEKCSPAERRRAMALMAATGAAYVLITLIISSLRAFTGARFDTSQVATALFMAGLLAFFISIGAPLFFLSFKSLTPTLWANTTCGTFLIVAATCIVLAFLCWQFA